MLEVCIRQYIFHQHAQVVDDISKNGCFVLIEIPQISLPARKLDWISDRVNSFIDLIELSALINENSLTILNLQNLD